ncbi:hypothetical protein NDU88_005065 [Pleurodeles waltl]|uniref:Uncharacterized protein n=1 Tax=Pleurodeles waltl TaxID=8319 RepID=A0AAV7TA98_PLEWA|nr:hypothetical protein NDU88_005065 [Pleurodeles waltl]
MNAEVGGENPPEYCEQVEAITTATRVRAWQGLIARKCGNRDVVLPGDQRPDEEGPGNECGGRWGELTRKPAPGKRPGAAPASQSDAVPTEPAGKCSFLAAGGKCWGVPSIPWPGGEAKK